MSPSAGTATRHGHTHRPAPSARSAWIGVGLGVVIIAALFLIDAFVPTLFPAALPTRAQDGLTLALSVLIEALPFVILGVLLSIVVQVWLPPDVIHRWLPRRAWAVVPCCRCSAC